MSLALHRELMILNNLFDNFEKDWQVPMRTKNLVIFPGSLGIFIHIFLEI